MCAHPQRPVHLSGNETAVTLIRLLFPQPQRALTLLKVPDVHWHLLAFRDRTESCSGWEGGDTAQALPTR